MRLFISLPLTKEARDFIGKNSNHLISNMGNEARLIPDYKWHFTLVFLGNQPEDIFPLEKIIKETAEEFKSPEVKLKKIISAPPGKKPRMVWLVPDNKSNERIAKIKNKLVKKLKEEKVEWKEEYRPFNGHITLAKFKPLSINKPLKIEKEINFTYQPPSIHLMKSTLKPAGAEYETIFESPFN
jgi:2'-5' RNA ligase